MASRRDWTENYQYQQNTNNQSNVDQGYWAGFYPYNRSQNNQPNVDQQQWRGRQFQRYPNNPQRQWQGYSQSGPSYGYMSQGMDSGYDAWEASTAYPDRSQYAWPHGNASNYDLYQGRYPPNKRDYGNKRSFRRNRWDRPSRRNRESGNDKEAIYNQKDDPACEAFKIEIDGIPIVVSYHQMKFLLGIKMDLNPHNIKIAPKVYVTFRTEEDREHAMKIIPKFFWKGQTLSAKIVETIPDEPKPDEASGETTQTSEDNPEGNPEASEDNPETMESEMADDEFKMPDDNADTAYDITETLEDDSKAGNDEPADDAKTAGDDAEMTEDNSKPTDDDSEMQEDDAKNTGGKKKKADDFVGGFKLEVLNLPPVVGHSQMKRVFEKKMNLKTHKVEVASRVIVTFRGEEDKQKALKTINGYYWKGEKLSAKCAAKLDDADGSANKSNGDQGASSSNSKRGWQAYEHLKIEIEGLPPVIGQIQIKKLLTKKMYLRPQKIKISMEEPKQIFVTFQCEEDRERALLKINKYFWKDRQLSAKKVDPEPQLTKKRRTEATGETEDGKKPKTEGEEEGEEGAKAEEAQPTEVDVPLMVKNAVTPLWNISYEDQLKDKQEEMEQFTQRFANGLKRTINQPCNVDELQCPLLPMIPSPTITGYRNKSELNIGLHPVTEEPTVGFRAGRYRKGIKLVAEASHCSNIPEIMHKAAEIFQSYIRSSSLSIFNPDTHEGNWRNLTLRCGRNNQLLVVVVFHPQSLTQEEIEAEKGKLKECFCQEPTLNVTSLYIQRFLKREKDEPPFEHVWGATFIEEDVMGRTFRISPESFFQINTLGAEQLYKTINEFVTVAKNTTIIDLCCGIGTTGIILAKNALKLVGVESSLCAVRDAWHNAETNNIKNVEFVCSKVEDAIFNVLKKAEDDNECHEIILIIDPPRAGLNNKVMKAIRGCPKLKRIVYLSCCPTLALNNFIDLCRPGSSYYRGAPFKALKSVAIDLFPQTSHCELILLLERK